MNGVTQQLTTNYTVSGNILTLKNQTAAAGSNITITYTDALLHQRGEPVLKLVNNQWVPVFYSGGELVNPADEAGMVAERGIDRGARHCR